MVPRFGKDGEPPPEYGPGFNEFSLEVHHGGSFCGHGANRTYVDSKVTWYDNLEVEFWCYVWIEDLVLQLDYGLTDNVSVYWLLPGKDLSDGCMVMTQVADRVKNFVLYFDHYKYTGVTDWDDVVLNPTSELPKVVSPVKVIHVEKQSGDKLPEFYSNIEVASHGNAAADMSDEDSEDSNYIDSDYDLEDGDDDLFADNVDEEVIDGGAGRGKKMSKGNEPSAGPSVPTQSEDSTDEDFDFDGESDGEREMKLKFGSFNPDDLVNPTCRTSVLTRRNFRCIQGRHG